MDVRLFTTPQHPCSYFSERQAQTQFLEPTQLPDARLYQGLIDQGFRRTGQHLYRPACLSCTDCHSLRLPVVQFKANRQQRRAWHRVAGRLEVLARAFEFEEGQYRLYERYLASRHADGDMANPSPADYLNFLSASWCKTVAIELYLDARLMAVAVTDLLPRGLSAVYSFFEPELEPYSPGVLAILAQVSLAQDLGKDFVYLGYWIPGCRKMAYKNRYRPHQLYIKGDWLASDS
jgi:arginine-tRNA-protein transferase